jgi:Zinc carboxypeptidase
MPYLFAEFLVKNYQTDPRVRRIVDGTEVWFVPMVNPDGHERTATTTDRWWTRNSPKPGRQSVILNRNYDTAAWKTLKTAYFSPDPNRPYYKGPQAAYAAEVQAMQKIVLQKSFKGVLSYHSHGRFVVFAPADKAAKPADPKSGEIAATVTAKINEKFTAKGTKGKQYENIQDNLLYSKMDRLKKPEQGFYAGSLTDFVSERLPDSIAVGVLLEPDRNDPRSYRLPASEIDSTFELHRASMLTFLNCVTTARKRPTAQPMKLNKPGIPTQLVAYQTDCAKAFPATDY